MIIACYCHPAILQSFSHSKLHQHERFQKEFPYETQEWRDQFATVEEFEVREDPEGQELFRGHLVIACANLDEDLELAEKITERFKEEFGKVSVASHHAMPSSEKVILMIVCTSRLFMLKQEYLLTPARRTMSTRFGLNLMRSISYTRKDKHLLIPRYGQDPVR